MLANNGRHSYIMRAHIRECSPFAIADEPFRLPYCTKVDRGTRYLGISEQLGILSDGCHESSLGSKISTA